MTASKLAPALSFSYNDQNYHRADGMLGPLDDSLLHQCLSWEHTVPSPGQFLYSWSFLKYGSGPAGFSLSGRDAFNKLRSYVVTFVRQELTRPCCERSQKVALFLLGCLWVPGWWQRRCLQNHHPAFGTMHHLTHDSSWVKELLTQPPTENRMSSPKGSLASTVSKWGREL